MRTASTENSRWHPSSRHYLPPRRRCRSRLHEALPHPQAPPPESTQHSTGRFPASWQSRRNAQNNGKQAQVLRANILFKSPNSTCTPSNYSSNQEAKLDTTRRGEPVSRLTARPRGLATDNTAGSRSTPMASGCGTMHVNARHVTPTNYKHNIQAQHGTSQRKPTITTRIQARHKQHSHNPQHKHHVNCQHAQLYGRAKKFLHQTTTLRTHVWVQAIEPNARDKRHFKN